MQWSLIKSTTIFSLSRKSFSLKRLASEIETNRIKDFVELDPSHVMIVQSQVCLHHQFAFVHNVHREHHKQPSPHHSVSPRFHEQSNGQRPERAACLALTSQVNEDTFGRSHIPIVRLNEGSAIFGKLFG